VILDATHGNFGRVFILFAIYYTAAAILIVQVKKTG
jgi:hypothetical protein